MINVANMQIYNIVSNFIVPPAQISLSDSKLTPSSHPQVLPSGVGKQNVLHCPFLVEQTVLSTSKLTQTLLLIISYKKLQVI